MHYLQEHWLLPDDLDIQADKFTILQHKKCNSLLGEEEEQKDKDIQCQNADHQIFVVDINADGVHCVNSNVSCSCSHYYCAFPDMCVAQL